ncbi:MAG: mechanosensitive ion channel domain-containing protein [Pseudomonadota bacterium]
MDPETVDTYVQELMSLSVQYGSKLLLALLVLILGWWFISRMLKLLDVGMDRAGIEATLQRFLLSFANIGLKTVLVVIVASMVGVETASLIALLGAAGLAVGLALQGSLSNFAGGVLILFFKPFRVGDVIEAQGFTGTVDEIQIFNTIMRTLDNQRVVIPNGILSNGCVKNLFIEPTRRVDMTFGISYEDDIIKAKEVIERVLAEDDNVLSDPAPTVEVAAHADSSVNFVVRPWCSSEVYWDVFFRTHTQLKLAFDREGITIPFPQRDVHLNQVA